MRLTTRAPALLLLAVVACSTDPTPTGVPPLAPRREILDGAHAGNSHFFFLPPMVAAPAYAGTFDGTRAPVVTICAWASNACGATIAQFTMTSGPESETVRVDAANELYVVNWHTDRFALNSATIYRIAVSVGSVELGHADVAVVNSGRELKNVATGEYIGLVDGRTLPVKFRIEQGAIGTPPPISASSIITTFAGNGQFGLGGLNGLATSAQLADPTTVAVGPDNVVYISHGGGSDQMGRVLRVDLDGVIRLVAGDGSSGPCAGDGGLATAAGLTWPQASYVASDGTIYLNDTGCGEARMIAPTGVISQIPGVHMTGRLAGGPDGSLYYVDGYQVKRRLPDGSIVLLAGTGSAVSSGDGGPALQAGIDGPFSITVGPDGAVYVNEASGSRIRRIDPATGIITRFAGTSCCGYSGDGGPAASAQLNGTFGMTVGPDGALYFADFLNHVVRRVRVDGIIETVAGTGVAGFSGDGGPAGQAQFGRVADVAFTQDGALLVADWDNQRVRRIK